MGIFQKKSFEPQNSQRDGMHNGESFMIFPLVFGRAL